MIDDELIQRFLKIFRSSDESYVKRLAVGKPRPSDGKFDASYVTTRGKVTEADVAMHLDGKICLVMKPELDDGTCFWAVLDHDHYSEQTSQVLCETIQLHGLPIHPYPSKSGGLHSLVLFKEPQPAARVRALLANFAAQLGEPPEIEMFPAVVAAGKLPYGIAMPFFNDRDGFAEFEPTYYEGELPFPANGNAPEKAVDTRTAVTGKIPVGKRYAALISEVGRIWQRGSYSKELAIATGLAWAKENFELGEPFNEKMVRGEIAHLIDSYEPGGADAIQVDRLLADPKAPDEARMLDLAALLPVRDYQSRRKRLAKKLDWQVTFLDDQVAKLRKADAPTERSGLILTKDGDVRPLLANAIYLLNTYPEWRGVLGFNEFSLYIVARKATPWGKTGSWTDTDDIRAAEWLQLHDCAVSSYVALEAVKAVASEHPFHPVREYLNDLEWDGVPRVDKWLTTYLGVEETLYSRSVGRMWLISGVARILQPGCQADYTLVAVGPQGIMKSTAMRTLAGNENFTDHLSDFNNKDSRMELHGRWIVEMAELENYLRQHNSSVKAFLTAVSDKFRLPYARSISDNPRTNIFCGSVNNETFLTDETGNRRFWPVECGIIDLDALARDRDQLWAEAVTLYREGREWWPTDKTLIETMTQIQDDAYDPGVFDDTIARWLAAPTQRFREEWHEDAGGKKQSTQTPVEPYDADTSTTTVEIILLHAIGKDPDKWNRGDQMAVAKCLKSLGYRLRRRKDGRKVYIDMKR